MAEEQINIPFDPETTQDQSNSQQEQEQDFTSDNFSNNATTGTDGGGGGSGSTSGGVGVSVSSYNPEENSSSNTLNNDTNGANYETSSNNNNNNDENNTNDSSTNNNANTTTNQGGDDEEDEDESDRLEPEQYRKLFIGSLNYNTPEETMRNYFGKYGDIVDCVIMKEPKSNKSRGFGFVTYSKSSMVDEVMKNRPHKLDGRELETKRATPREEAGKPGAELTTKKLFVGAIKEGLTEDHLKEYFTPYGAITDCVIMREKESNKSRGFGFVSFDDYDPVDKIVLEKYHTINGQSVAVKKALPKDQAGGGGGFRNRGPRNDYHGGHNDYDDNYGNNNGFGGGGGGGGGNFNFNNLPNNFAQMAQKMFQAAAMQNQNNNNNNNNYGKGRQTNFASDDFEGFQGFAGKNSGGGGGGSGGPMRTNKFGGRSGGPYHGGRGGGNNSGGGGGVGRGFRINNNNPNMNNKPPM